MSHYVEFRDLGTMPYGECWELQRRLFDSVIESKREVSKAGEGAAGYILMVEHPAVYTLGKSGKSENMLLTPERIAQIGAEYYHIDRGGDVTFHGRGQIVCYPILDLEAIGIGLRDYIDSLEQAVIESLAQYGVEAQRSEGASGVWITKGAPMRKICAIGVKSSRYVTMHGLALNVSTDLSYFDYINPCGFTNRGVTSLNVESGADISFEEVKALLLNNLIKILNVKIYKK